MPDICVVTVNSNDEKTIELLPNIAGSLDCDIIEKTDQHSAPYCFYHFKADKNKGWAEIEIEPLPNVMMSIREVQSLIHPLLRVHTGDIPVASLLFCLEAEANIKVQPNDQGVSLEHLVAAVPGVHIKNNDYGIKVITSDEHVEGESEKSWWSQKSLDILSTDASLSKGSLNFSCGEAADQITKEVIELIKMCPKSTMMFSKFIPTYHNHFGKQCRVADYGCTKLIEMFDAMPTVVQVTLT